MRELGSLESALMECLWSAPAPMSVREVQRCLGGNELAYTTVMSTLATLYRKGLLTREADGRAYRYAPVQSREAYSAELISDVLLASHDPEATLLRLLGALTPEQARALRSALDDAPVEPPAPEDPGAGG
jgi:predicted transcriptional regulator